MFLCHHIDAVKKQLISLWCLSVLIWELLTNGCVKKQHTDMYFILSPSTTFMLLFTFFVNVVVNWQINHSISKIGVSMNFVQHVLCCFILKLCYISYLCAVRVTEDKWYKCWKYSQSGWKHHKCCRSGVFMKSYQSEVVRNKELQEMRYFTTQDYSPDL